MTRLPIQPPKWMPSIHGDQECAQQRADQADDQIGQQP
jgi:hypothetical protein